MTELYEVPKYRDDDEHVYTAPLPVTDSGNSEPQTGTSPGNGANKGEKSSKAIRVVVLVLGIIIVVIVALVGTSVYLLLSPKPNVFCQKDQPGQECQTIDTVLTRLTAEVTKLTTEETSRTEPTVNASWSTWGSWRTCSQTCGSGVTTRFRRCDCPAPSSSGRDCKGDPVEAKSCNVKQCIENTIDGSWSKWGSWSKCSQTCGFGVTTRFRRCDSPAPSSSGRDCIEYPMEAESCKVAACKSRAIGFSMKDPVPGSPAHQMTFQEVLTNEGDAYNTSTGVFTCPVAGTYFFSLNLLTVYSYSVSRVACNIKKNDNILVTAFTKPGNDSAKGNKAAVAAVYTRLTVGDTVMVRGCDRPIKDVFNFQSSFSGFLVTPDD